MKFLKLISLSVCFASFLEACKMSYPVEKVAYKVENTSLLEGKRLTILMCGPCHYNSSTKDFSGKKLEDSPAFLGKIYASNITQHKKAGIGSYTSGELAYLIRTGLSKDGKLMPYMKRPNLADKDLQNIIAYLQSDNEMVKPSERVPGKTDYTPIGKFGISMSKPLPYKSEEVEKPTSKVELGKYLIDNLGCYHCHSRSFPSLDLMEPEKSKGYLGGGNKMRKANGKTIKSPNITFHPTGISAWKEEDLKRALREGINKQNEIITFPMPLYPELTDVEISAIYTYLKSVPGIKNKSH